MDDVIIIGAGIIGLAAAHALAEAGAKVRVLDRHLPGSGQSTRTGGGIRLSHGSATNVRLTQASLPVWEAFAERFGVNPRYRTTGHLFLTSDPERADDLAGQATWQADEGVRSDILTRDEIARRWPHLRTVAGTTGSHCATGGYLDHHRVIQGYTRAVEARGATILPGVRVEGLVQHAGGVVGVETSEGRFDAGAIVNAAGPDAGAVAAMAGLDIPFVSRRHQLLIVRPHKPVPDATPWLIDLDAQVHMRPDGQGRALVGGFLGRDDPADPANYDRNATSDWCDRVRTEAEAAFGLVSGDSPILEAWAGLYPGTRDYQPVLEVSRPGLITAAGFSGTGLMHAPAVGQIVRDLVQGGVTDVVDVAPLASDRFKDDARVVETTGF